MDHGLEDGNGGSCVVGINGVLVEAGDELGGPFEVGMAAPAFPRRRVEPRRQQAQGLAGGFLGFKGGSLAVEHGPILGLETIERGFFHVTPFCSGEPTETFRGGG